MKKNLRKLFVVSAIIAASTGHAFAQLTYDWTGATNTAWTTASNWSVGGTPQTGTNYPGGVGRTLDVVRIGVNAAVPTFTNQPVFNGSITLKMASITFGNNNAAVGGAAGDITLTVTGATTALKVSGAILQMHSPTGGAANSGGIGSTDCFSCITNSSNTSLLGTGTITCGSLQVGDNVVGSELYVNDVTNFNIGNSNTNVLTVNVTGNFTVNSASANDGDAVTKSSRANVILQGAKLTIGGTLKLTNFNPFSYVLGQYQSVSEFAIALTKNQASAVLNFGGAIPVSINSNIYAFNSVDFLSYADGTFPATRGSETSTVNYTGTNQPIYATNSTTNPDKQIDQTGNTTGDGYMYDNLTISGSGTKTVSSGTLTVYNNFTLSTIGVNTETVDLVTNSSNLLVNGNYSTTSGATLNTGTGTATITGTSYANSGTSNFGTGPVTFNAIAAATFSGTGTTNFTNVLFNGGNANSMTAGTYNVKSNGILTLSKNGANNTSIAAGGFLTLKSDATGSATVAAIPAGCTITGNVNAQRYLTGSRGYRLIASPVNANNGVADANNNLSYSLNYVKNSAYITGTTAAAGGFDNTAAANPTLYLYREDVPVSNASFISGNFRGINNLMSAPTYGLDNEGATCSIPVSNGFLFFFRGNRADGTFAQETATTWPATTATLSTTGYLNQQQIVFRDWYTPTSIILGYSNPDIAAQGFNLAANPYASTIDWETYTTTNDGTGIYASNLSDFVYELNPTTKNYDIYQKGGVFYTNNGTRYISSGQGFFVLASNASGQLIFNESAKTSTQVPAAKLMMGKPVAINSVQMLRIELAKDTINKDNIVISFGDNAKPAYVFNEDAPYRIGTGVLSLSSISNDNRALSVNKLPLSNGLAIPLKVGATADGDYTLNLKEIKGVPQLFDVWLKDAYKNDSVNMRHSATYSFTITKSDTASLGSKRFSLILRENQELAVKLLSFTANKADKKRQVEVIWKAVNEQNYTHFTVERSIDNGETFDIIGGLTSGGQGTYSLLDKDPVKGINMYRLKQEDYNNSISYSKVAVVRYADNNHDLITRGRLNVFPNPAINKISLSIDPKSMTTTYSIRITNSVGMVVKQAATSELNWQGNVSNLLTGTYLIQVLDKKDNSLIGQTKFVKL